MNKTTISIIVPVYNVEKYLRRCIDSVLAQSFQWFELILIDDGSTDESGKICDEYKESDCRIKVIHKSNEGVSRARNVGIASSIGEYVTFVDSDDYIDNDYLQVLYDNILDDYDCVSIGYYKVDQDGSIIEKATPKDDVFLFENSKEKYRYIVDMVLNGKAGWELWTRIFKTSIIKSSDIKMCESCENFAEDLGFFLSYILHCNSIKSVDYPGYYYTMRNDSMMQSSQNRIRLNSMNEISYFFYCHLKKMDDSKYICRRFPLIHFLVIYNQIIKCYFSGDIEGIIDESNQIKRKKWYNRMALRCLLFRKAIIRSVGKSKAKWCMNVYYFSVHRNSKIYLFREYI